MNSESKSKFNLWLSEHPESFHPSDEARMFREDNKDSLTSVRNKIDAHRDEDVCMQIETAENLHLSDAVKLILDYGRIVNELGTVVNPMKQLGILRLESVFHDRNR